MHAYINTICISNLVHNIFVCFTFVVYFSCPALTARLTAEAEHPRVVVGEISDPHVPSGSHQQQSSYMDKLQQLLTQRQPSQTQQNQPQ